MTQDYETSYISLGASAQLTIQIPHGSPNVRWTDARLREPLIYFTPVKYIRMERPSAQDRWDIYTNSCVRGKILNVSTCTKIHKILRSCVVHLEVGTRKDPKRSLQDPKIQRSHWIFTRSKDPDPRNDSHF